jgi:2'-hydroxyisoflavone reductase
MEEFVYGVRAATTAPTTWTWIEDYDFLRANRVDAAVPWVRLDGDNEFMTDIVIEKAVSRGLTFRPLAATVRDTLDWWHSSAVLAQRRQNPRFVFTPERERELLDSWKATRR